MSVGKLPLVWVVGVLAVCCWIVSSGLAAGSREAVQSAAADTHLHPLNRLAALQQGPSRLVASKAMTTFVVYRTTIPTCSFTTSCAMINGAVTACRRLDRDVDIDAILPNKPVKVETTMAPEESPAIVFVPDILSSNEPRDVLVNGLLPGGSCGPAASLLAGSTFGVTIIYTRTIISDFTCLSSVTQTNTFTLAGCTPTGLVYCSP
ncbi:hypothetical protein DAPPUDRAFT_106923 [Daphnia pulex]|uniref:Uncharacterized protein n=1 Tax=Daphnia pulex TaxID=6669 RepID=E9GVE3_DAPPU|nr:hypothetical protein DAPPUDRAFT_106923 [Daphnia pulex]|eukprot:EFX76399.1 hypothetical protein DAPPUDRAFT_106923 [Daphnia pulex]